MAPKTKPASLLQVAPVQQMATEPGGYLAFARPLHLDKKQAAALASMKPTEGQEVVFDGALGIPPGPKVLQVTASNPDSNSGDAAVISDVQLTDLSCATAWTGTMLYQPPEGGGGGDDTDIGFDLDTANPSAEIYSTATNKLAGQYFAHHNVQVVPGSPQVLSIYVTTAHRACSFRLSLTVSEGSRTENKEIDDGGRPFRVTANLSDMRSGGAVFAAYGTAYIVDYPHGLPPRNGLTTLTPVDPRTWKG